MLTIGDKFPDFSVQGVVSTNPANAFQDFNQDSDKGKWKLVFFWPKDFTFVCPTEIAGFGKLNGDFNDRDTVIYGVSTDSEFVHLAWRQNHADTNQRLSRALGILDEEAGVAKRATFLVDPEGIIRFVYVTDMSVGRNPAEVLRVLDALQTDELCPCNWNKGDDVLKPAA
jgi:peroxiredoxin (alkyl hydroperoxide reductase subunit C)